MEAPRDVHDPDTESQFEFSGDLITEYNPLKLALIIILYCLWIKPFIEGEITCSINFVTIHRRIILLICNCPLF